MRCTNDCFKGIYWKSGIPILCKCPLEGGWIMPREVIKWFGQVMEEKLKANDHKVDWTEADFEYLILRLEQEIEELKEALEEPLSPNDAIKECADISNFAMFIADKIHQLKNDPPWGDRGK